MELGNMIFGNSRGPVGVDRDEQFEGPLYTLLEECCGDTRGGGGFENDTFKVMPYYWGECVCGWEDKVNAIRKNHDHKDDCYQQRLKSEEIAAGIHYKQKWQGDYQDRVAIQNAIYEQITSEYGLPMRGCAVHCTCGIDKKVTEMIANLGGHADHCPIDKPNFLHKPTGYELQWYKYPLRDAYANRKVTPLEFLRIIFDCLRSLGK